MSSQYRAICLNHDPAIELGEGDCYSADQALGEVRNQTGMAVGHEKCDLLIGRYSYPLLEVCCPGATHMENGYEHSHPVWVSVGWLRLAHAAAAAGVDVAKTAGRVAECWHPKRVERLLPLLGEAS